MKSEPVVKTMHFSVIKLSRYIFSRPYLNNGRTIGMVVVVCLSACHGCIVAKL